MSSQILLWVGFNIFILILLALDLGVLHRGDRVINLKESLFLSAIWIVVALIFNIAVYFWRGPEVALQFLTGYLIEKSLSIDNLFIFLMIFSYFRVASQLQYKVLFWGILGALIMRAFFIATGVVLITMFHWVIYVFGAFLIFTAARMAFEKGKEMHPEKNPVLRILGRFIPITEDYAGNKFFIRKEGKLYATPLLVVLLVIESTDVVFAVDSIPAILGVTTDPFIVYTSNVFAILGLRALYFALASIMGMFHYLKIGLSIILAFVGLKMLLSNFYQLPIVVTLGVVALTLVVSVLASLIFPQPR
jgi:tellurite resistance protein TerC